MEHAGGARHRLALVEPENPGAVGETPQRKRPDRQGARPLFPLAGFHRRPGERRGHGRAGSKWAEMIRGDSGWAPAARRTSIYWLVSSFVIAGLAAELLEPERVTTIIEALTRLGPEKVEANPKLKLGIGFDLLGTEAGQCLNDRGDAFGLEQFGRKAGDHERRDKPIDRRPPRRRRPTGVATNHFSPLTASSAMAASFSGPAMKS